MNRFFDTIWKSLVVGAVYVVALSIVGMLIRLAGLNLPQINDMQARILRLFIGGTIIGFSLGPIATSMPALRSRHLLVWGSVIFFNIASVTIEGRFFSPELIGNSLPGLLLQQVLTALVMGWIVATLFAPKDKSTPTQLTHRHWFSWSWRFFVSAFSYVVFYFIFGAINYTLVTKPYYAAHVSGLTVPSPQTVLIAELVRSLLIVLSILPFLLTFRTNKPRLAVLTGLIIFSIGGLVPLTLQAGVLPLFLLAASAVEIFFQNFSTGWLTARLLGQPESR